jgi:hypothetical protein
MLAAKKTGVCAIVDIFVTSLWGSSEKAKDAAKFPSNQQNLHKNRKRAGSRRPQLLSSARRAEPLEEGDPAAELTSAGR